MKNQRLKENDKVKTYHSLVHNFWTTTNIIAYNVISIPKLNVNGEDDTIIKSMVGTFIFRNNNWEKLLMEHTHSKCRFPNSNETCST